MKTFSILLFVTVLMIGQDLFAQNGVYQSSKFEFINKNEPSRNRVEYKTNTLTFQINESSGEFTGGKILWEMKNDEQSEFLEMSLVRMKNSFFDEKSNAFVKVYDANIMMLGQVVGKEDIYITKFIKTNLYRLEMYNTVRQTINRFDNIKKL
ncbi:MAG: hypothetical protein WBH03_01300 [Cyclobacteriaceae bacterium]